MDRFEKFLKPLLIVSIFLLSLTSLVLSVVALKHSRHHRGHFGKHPGFEHRLSEEQKSKFEACLKEKGITPPSHDGKRERHMPSPEEHAAFRECFHQVLGEKPEAK